MIDVTNIDTSVSLFNTKYPIPIGIAPSAMQKLVGGEGEMDVAAGARALDLNMTLSSQSTTSLEDVMRAGNTSSPAKFWFQLYLTQDPEKSIPLIKRAEGE